MSAQQAAWEQLPLGVQQRILVLAGNPCARRVSKAWRDYFDAANDTLSFSHVLCRSLEMAATAAAMRVVKNSASLTAVNIVDTFCRKSPPLMLSDLLAAGVATRLRKLTGTKLMAACAAQQVQALRQCTSLTHLDISGSYLQDCLAVDLAAALLAMPRLTCLHMCSCDLQSQRVVAALASALQPLTQLQHLHLVNCRLGEAELAALAPALSGMPGLQTLDVSNNMLSGAAGAKALCTLLGAVPGLTHLDISYSSLLEEGAALLAAVLQSMTRLQTVNMCGSKIHDEAMVVLAPALAALPSLHTLNLSSNWLGANAVSVLQPVLAREGNPLRELDLSSSAFGVEGAQSLASGLRTATQLQALSLKHTRLGDEAWVVLAPALSRLGPTLQELQLNLDNVGDAGSVAVIEALRVLTALTRLEVKDSSAMVIISPALMGMRRLQVLDLGSNAMSVEGTVAIAAVLPALTGSLKHLDLSCCGIDVEAAANALAPALAQATGLVKLFLGSNDFGPQGAQRLVPVLSALPHLRKVDLDSCMLGVQGCMAVAHALKGRDGALVDLKYNRVTIGSIEGVELYNMPGINVRM